MVGSQPRGIGGWILRAFYLLLLTIGAFVMIIPFLWSVSTALKPLGESVAFPPIWWPHPIMWNNFVITWKIVPLARWFFNSLLVAFIVVFGNLIFDSLAGYALARIRFKGRSLIFLSIISMLMIPFQAIMLPTYILLRDLGLINTYWGMILPTIISAMGVFLMRQAFLGIPAEIDEAAIIDGASRWRMFWQIALPMVKPNLLTLALLTFMGSWNNFLLPLLVANNPKLWTLPLGMVMFQQQYFTNWPYLMASVVMATIPTAILFLVFQRWFVEGISTTGIR
ncbi:MAG: sugar ABC transporter permease [Sulfobacillus thermosulfidooxidans]|uniref:Sugar ABC transporter permease n=1 Tax=Sulfobacillus thermosulfidooxidans TaxID=28034 RepID=A0A2T2WYP6_SULTH|nr:MAG: sugar ABC transporter permease [Sulfobacillus thermosulfidooxidans]